MPFSFDDPFEQSILPPENETPETKAARFREEAQARRISEQIDAQLQADKALATKRKKQVKILLLGQSESGKSTTLKNFQLLYAPKSFHAERLAWRAVIQLNLIRSVNTLLDVIARELALTSAPSPHSPFSNSTPVGDDEIDEVDPGSSPRFDGMVHDPPQNETTGSSLPLPFTKGHRDLHLRLAPLRRIELDLRRKLGAASSEVDSDYFSPPFTLPTNSSLGLAAAHVAASSESPPPGRRNRPEEFFVHANASWKAQLMPTSISLDEPSTTLESNRRHAGHSRDGGGDVEDAMEVLASCCNDIRTLWQDTLLQQALKRHDVRIEDKAGFFLDDVDRIATCSYEPSDDDIMRARLRTVGVQEHRLLFEQGQESGSEWLIYDVGGSRTSRVAWLPYFTDLTAIIFLAPISAFDETLLEDARVNRLEDTLILWRAVCGSELLQKVNFVLLMNKKDLLERKIANGVRFADFVTSYGTRSNDASVIAKYLRGKFKDVLKTKSPEPRQFFGYLTSVIDVQSTSVTLSTVKAGIIRDHLRAANML